MLLYDGLLWYVVICYNLGRDGPEARAHEVEQTNTQQTINEPYNHVIIDNIISINVIISIIHKNNTNNSNANYNDKGRS